jgi:hypothetical protein
MVSITQFDYTARASSLFARIERWTNLKTGEIHWRSITRDNVTRWQGQQFADL